MEEQDNVDPEYLKGFNEGYLMAIYKPDFVDQLVQVQTDSPRHAGFIAGRDQLIAEKEAGKNIVPPWLDKLYNNVASPLKAIPPEKDGGDLEPDKG